VNAHILDTDVVMKGLRVASASGGAENID